VIATAVDRDHDASFARIRLTGDGPILYRSIVTRSVVQRKVEELPRGNRV